LARLAGRSATFAIQGEGRRKKIGDADIWLAPEQRREAYDPHRPATCFAAAGAGRKKSFKVFGPVILNHRRPPSDGSLSDQPSKKALGGRLVHARRQFAQQFIVSKIRQTEGRVNPLSDEHRFPGWSRIRRAGFTGSPRPSWIRRNCDGLVIYCRKKSPGANSGAMFESVKRCRGPLQELTGKGLSAPASTPSHLRCRNDFISREKSIPRVIRKRFFLRNPFWWWAVVFLFCRGWRALLASDDNFPPVIGD